MEQYFSFLDQLRESGTINMMEADRSLREEFPELKTDKERARKILMAWMSSFGPTHLSGANAGGTEAEALFLFGDFLADLAETLGCSSSKEKCALCAFLAECGGRDAVPPCSWGILKFLLDRAARYHARMSACYREYFSFLDQIQKQGGYDQHTAEQALMEEYPWLLSHPEYAKYALASWMLKYWG